MEWPEACTELKKSRKVEKVKIDFRLDSRHASGNGLVLEVRNMVMQGNGYVIEVIQQLFHFHNFSPRNFQKSPFPRKSALWRMSATQKFAEFLRQKTSCRRRQKSNLDQGSLDFEFQSFRWWSMRSKLQYEIPWLNSAFSSICKWTKLGFL